MLGGAAAAGVALGIATLTGGALLLYTGEGFLSSAGTLMAVTLASTAAGLWAGAPDTTAPGRMSGRWMLGILALVAASFLASAWLRLPVLQATALGPALGMVLFLAAPAYAVGGVLAALHARRGAAVATMALLGAGIGVAAAASWLIPSLPPGPVYFGAALLLAVAGTTQMALDREAAMGAMSGSVVLVTGVGKPGQVGYALAQAFRGAGAHVVVAGRSAVIEERARALGEGVVGVAADLTTEEGAVAAVEAARVRWGRLDVLVNAAGGLRVVKPLADTSPAEWTAEIDRNARTAFLVGRAALPLLRESRGCIINFASPAGERGVARLGAYSAAKAGVIALTRAMAAEEKAAGVRVNAIAPGMVDTDDNRAAAGDAGQTSYVSRDAIAEAAMFLARAQGVSGEVLHVTHADVRGGGQGG